MTELLDDPTGGSFAYSNLSDRPPGPVVAQLARVVPGVRSVMGQVEPYAQWWQESNRRALASRRPLWVTLGDSLSQGIGASAPDRGWVGRLMNDPTPSLAGTAVLNLSFNGARVVDVLERQLPVLEGLRSLGHDVAAVSLLIGNNDLMSPVRAKLLPGSARELMEAVPTGTVVSLQPGMQRSAAQFNEVVLDAAARRGLVAADFRVPHLRDFLGRLAQDSFHPNDRGYAHMAHAARRAL